MFTISSAKHGKRKRKSERSGTLWFVQFQHTPPIVFRCLTFLAFRVNELNKTSAKSCNFLLKKGPFRTHYVIFVKIMKNLFREVRVCHWIRSSPSPSPLGYRNFCTLILAGFKNSACSRLQFIKKVGTFCQFGCIGHPENIFHSSYSWCVTFY